MQKANVRRTRTGRLIAAVSLVNLVAGSALATDFYWDTNGTTAGAGATPSGTWSTGSATWNTLADGTAATGATTTTTTDDAYFAAGTGASGYTITVSGSQSIRNMQFDDGPLTLSGSGTLVMGTTPILTTNTNVEIATSVTSAGLTKKGSGTLTLTNASIASNTLMVSGGRLVFGGTATHAPTTANWYVNGATFILDNRTTVSNDRLPGGGGGGIMNSGTLVMYGNATTAVTELVRNMQTDVDAGFASGYNTITLSAPGSATLFLRVNSFARLAGGVGGGTLFLNGNNLGKDSTSTSNVTWFRTSSLATLIGTTDPLSTGINAAAKNTKIIPFAVSEADAVTGGLGTQTGVANTFLTYQGTASTGTGARPLNPIDEFTQNAIVAGDNTRITSATTANTSAAINSVIVAGANLSIADGATLTVSSGAVLFTTAHQIRPSGTTGTLTFDVNEGFVTVNEGVSATISSKILGSVLNKTGKGTLVLSADNDYTGLTVINGGVLRVTNNEAISGGLGSTGVGNLRIYGGVLGLDSGNFQRTLGTGAGQIKFAGAGIGALNSGGFAAYTLDRTVTLGTGAATAWSTGGNSFLNSDAALLLSADDANAKLTFVNPLSFNVAEHVVDVRNGSALVDGELAGIISGAGGALTKIGLGTLQLSAINTYTGATAINAGTLAVTGSLAAGSAVTVNRTGTLGGTGTVNGTVQVNSGGAVAPGVGLGTLTTGGLSMSGSTLKIDVDTIADKADQLIVTSGGVSLGASTLELTFTAPVNGSYTESFTLIRNDTGTAVTGLLNGIAQNGTFNYGQLSYSINYAFDADNSDGLANDVRITFTSVPEPSTVGLLAIGAAGLLRRRRRC